MHNFGEKIALAVIVCLVDLLESFSIATALANRNNYELNATQEITALGLGNLLGAAFNCYTTTGTRLNPHKILTKTQSRNSKWTRLVRVQRSLIRESG